MSRIGRLPVQIPDKVEVTVQDGLVRVKGPKGELEQRIDPRLEVKIEGNTLTVSRPSDERSLRAQHGLARTLINNMIVGVSQGFSKALEVQGPTKVVVSGIDKVLVGQVAAKIRSFRPPEPYKGKGIRYEGEQIRRKAGKTG